MDEAGAREALAVTAGDADTANSLYDHYRAARATRGAGSDPLTVFDSVMTDYVFRIPADRLLDSHSTLGGAGRAYAYVFPAVAGDGRSAAGTARARYPVRLRHGRRNASVHRRGPADRPTRRLRHGRLDQLCSLWPAGVSGRSPAGPQYRADQRYTMVLGPDVKTIREEREREREIWTSDLLE